jgi:hypothetical protein
MKKYLVAVALAAVVEIPEAASQSVLQRSDWQPKDFESYLPAPPTSVPWLDLDARTKLSKRDLPIGWQANALLPFTLPHVSNDAQVSSNTAMDVWRM